MELHGFHSKHTPTYDGPGSGGSYQYRFRFPNGYGASLIVGGFAYGGLEIAVLRYYDPQDDRGSLCYDTPITDDVLGYLSGPEEVESILDSIAALPPAL